MELLDMLIDKIKLNMPVAMVTAQRNKLRKMILSQVSDEDLASLTPLELRMLAEDLYVDYMSSLVEAKKMVGVVASQTMGEVQTQASLDSHRTAGLASGREKFTGLPRLLQVIENTKPTLPTMFLYPRQRHTVQEMKRLIAKFQFTIIDDVLVSVVLKESSDPEVADLPFHTVFSRIYGSIEKPRWVVRLKFDVQKLYDRRITLASVAQLMTKSVRDIQTLFSDMSTGIIDVYYHGNEMMQNYGAITRPGEDTYFYIRDSLILDLRGLQISGMKNIDKVFLNSISMVELVNGFTMVSPGTYALNLNDRAFRSQGVQLEWIHEWIVEQFDGDAVFLPNGTFTTGLSESPKEMMARIGKEDVPLSRLLGPNGEPDQEALRKHGVSESVILPYLRNERDAAPLFASKYRQFLSEFWFIETRGINMVEIQFMPEINPRYTWCNSGEITLLTYGIEATRYWQESEASEAGLRNVSSEHKSLLFDTATRDGVIHAMNDTGLERANYEMLTQMNFEKNASMMLSSAYAGRSDSLSSIASSVITGNMAQMGTGAADILYDPNLAENMVKRLVPPKRTAPPRHRR